MAVLYVYGITHKLGLESNMQFRDGVSSNSGSHLLKQAPARLEKGLQLDYRMSEAVEAYKR